MFKEDLNPVATQADQATEGQIGIGDSDANGTVAWQDVPHHSIIVGDSSNDAQIVGTTGDVTIASNGGSAASMTIGENKVVTLKIADENVTYAKFEHGTAGSLPVFGVPTTNTGTDVVLNELVAGENGDVLKTIIANGKTYLAWEDPGSVSTLAVADGSSQEAALPVCFSATSNGSASAVYGDSTPFTYEADLSNGTLRVPAIISSGDIQAGTFTGVAATATGVLTDVSTDSTLHVALFDNVGNGSNYQSGLTNTGITYNGNTNTLTVSNLNVSGTTTTVNTEDLIIQDNTITLSVPQTSTNGSIVNGNQSGVVICTNANGGDDDDTSSDVTWNPRIMWNNSGSVIDGATGISTDANGVPSTTTLGWSMAGRGAGGAGVSTAVSTQYNIAPTVVFGNTYVGSGGSSTASPIDDIGIGAQYLTNEGANGVKSRLFIQVD